MLLKFLDIFIYGGGVIGALLSGYLVYSALVSGEEKLLARLRIHQRLKSQKEQFVKESNMSKAEVLLKEVGYPLKVNGFRYRIFRISLLGVLSINYLIIPFLLTGEISLYMTLFIVTIGWLTQPRFPYSIFRLVMHRLIELRKAKRNNEVFQLHDLLVSEIDMMTNNRVNTYSILRSLYPYFTQIKQEIAKLLRNWKNDPDQALSAFADEIGTKEAEALVAVLKRLDANEREVAMEALRSHGDLFAKSQIENYRRRKKLFTDLSSIPIRAAHFFIILNFIAIVVYMVMGVLSDARL